MSTDQSSPFLSVRIPEFKLFILQRFFSIMALRAMGTVVAIKMYEITKDPLMLAFVGLSEAIPAISMALYSGHIIDRSDKRTLLVRTIICYFLCALGLLFITLQPVEISMGKRFVQYAIYFVFFCTGVIRSFSGPGTSSILAQLVPRSILPNAVTWSTSTYLSASVMGHATAGFLVVFIGYMGSFIVIMGYLLIACVCMLQIKSKPVMHARMEQNAWESVKEGLKFVMRSKVLLGALSLDMFAVLFGGVTNLIIFFAYERLMVGPIAFGWLNAATDIGSILVIWTLIFRPLRGKQGLKLMYAVAGFGICIIIFGLSKVYWLSFLALFASGILDGISVIIRGTIMQLSTPDEMRGRVSAVNTMFINSSNEIGQVESGVAARLLGKVPSVIFGGGMTLLVVIISWFKAPSLRKFEY